MRDGCQLKINMVVRQLPELKSGIDPRLAFAGTFHINESYFQLERAFEEARDGKIPTEIPSEMYCHTLTDNSNKIIARLKIFYRQQIQSLPRMNPARQRIYGQMLAPVHP